MVFFFAFINEVNSQRFFSGHSLPSHFHNENKFIKNNKLSDNLILNIALFYVRKNEY